MVGGEVSSASVAIRRLEGDRYASEMFATELKNVAKHTRHLDPEFIDASGHDITQAFLDYALPLVGNLPPAGRFAAERSAAQSER
jgi:6-phosphofructokinase 1